MSFKKGENGINEGGFMPKSVHEKKLFIANKLAR
jgi:hypothetical protein